MEWRDVPAFVQDKAIVDAESLWGSGEVRLVFACGCRLEVRSEYDAGPSDYTPGAGIEPPTVEETTCGLHESER